ncbi:MAG: hypothetical protein AB8B55_10210 [Mariniblastus sp.]
MSLQIPGIGLIDEDRFNLVPKRAEPVQANPKHANPEQASLNQIHPGSIIREPSPHFPIPNNAIPNNTIPNNADAILRLQPFGQRISHRVASMPQNVADANVTFDHFNTLNQPGSLNQSVGLQQRGAWDPQVANQSVVGQSVIDEQPIEQQQVIWDQSNAGNHQEFTYQNPAMTIANGGPWQNYQSRKTQTDRRYPFRTLNQKRLARIEMNSDRTPMRAKLRAEGLYLSRTGGPDDSPFLFDQFTSAPILSHSDLEFGGSENATRYSFLFQSVGGTGFEFSFFDMDGFVTESSHPGSFPLMFGGIPASFTSGYDVRYDSRLKNYEFNTWIRERRWLRWGAGLRHIDLRENFNAVATGSTTATSRGSGFFSDTDNDLFGAQAMIELRYQLATDIRLEGGIKGGLFTNNLDVRYFSQNRELHYEDKATTTVIDFNIGIAYDITRNVGLRFGYQNILIDDVALAPDQSAAVGFFDTSAPAQLGETTYDGAYFGVEMRF